MSKRKRKLDPMIIPYSEMATRFQQAAPRVVQDAYTQQLIMLKAHTLYLQTWEHHWDLTMHVVVPFEKSLWGIQAVLRTVQRIAMLDQIPAKHNGAYTFDKKNLRAGLERDFSDLSTFWGKLHTIAASQRLADTALQDTLLTIITRLQDIVENTMQGITDMLAGDGNASSRILEHVTDSALREFNQECEAVRSTLRNLSRPTSAIYPAIWETIKSHPGTRIDALRDMHRELDAIHARDRTDLQVEIMATLQELIDLYPKDNASFHKKIDKIKAISG